VRPDGEGRMWTGAQKQRTDHQPVTDVKPIETNTSTAPSQGINTL